MYELYNVREAERLDAIISDWEGSGAGLQILLFLANRDYTDWLVSGNIASTDNSPALLADLTLETRPPKDLDRAPVRVVADIDGIMVPLLSGVKTYLDPQPDYKTHLVSASPGALLNQVRLLPTNTVRNVTEYAFWSPDRIIRDAVMRAAGFGGYNQGRIFISPFAGTLNYTSLNSTSGSSNQGFEDNAHLLDVLNKVAQDTNAFYRDDPELGFWAIRDPRSRQLSDIAWRYETQSMDVLAWKPPALKSPDEQFTDVLVRKREQDGSYSVLGYAKVNATGTPYPPFPDQTYIVDWSDTTSSNRAEMARQLATDYARMFALGVHSAEQTLAFNPLLQKGDVLQFFEDYFDERGRFRREWRAFIVSLKQDIKEDGVATVPTCDFYLVEERRVPDPINVRTLLQDRSAGTLGPQVGKDNKGVWIDLESAFAWSGMDEGGLYIVPENAGSLVGLDAGGLWVDTATGASEQAMGYDGQVWLDTAFAIFSSSDAGGIWVEPDFTEGLMGADAGGLWADVATGAVYPSETLYPSEMLYPWAG